MPTCRAMRCHPAPASVCILAFSATVGAMDDDPDDRNCKYNTVLLINNSVDASFFWSFGSLVDFRCCLKGENEATMQLTEFNLVMSMSVLTGNGKVSCALMLLRS